ncbi:MAG: ABC transporter ATP-binding protein [Bacteroidota bacterium]
MENTIIRVEKLQKHYGSFLALNVPQLSLEPGIHWVKGGNGSGKTTFFKTLAGLLPFEGSVIFNETLHLQKHPVDCRRIVNYGEAEPLYPAFVTGKDLIQLFADSKKADQDQVQTVMKALGVAAFAPQAVGTYSSGMLKKLSLVLAFIGQPKIILLDEPLITLDVATVAIVYDLILEHQARGTTFLISSHQAFEDEKLAFNSILSVENQAITKHNMHPHVL